MLAIKLILEGLGLGFLLYLVCAAGIRNGAIGMVHLHMRRTPVNTSTKKMPYSIK